jgi:two-component system chemotaxis response regulator CheB
MKKSGEKPPTTQNPSRDVLVIGGSSGALDPMIQLVSALPEGYRGSLFIVSHIGANPSQLPELLTQAGWLRAAHARHGEPVEPCRIYVAPPDRHMILADRQVILSALPREHFTRPAVDPLFRSAARAYGARVVGIVLSGSGDDGALGLREIQRAGGVAVVQAPADAASPEMPRAALRAVTADHVVDAAALAALVPYLDNARGAAKMTGKADVAVSSHEDMTMSAALTCPRMRRCGP